MSEEFWEKLRAAGEAFREAIEEQEKEQETWWDTLTPDQQLDAFCCVVRRIHKGDVVEGGSYRYVLYDVCGFGPEAYVPAQCAGYLDIHNLIFEGLEHQKQKSDVEISAEIKTLDEVIKPDRGYEDERKD